MNANLVIYLEDATDEVLQELSAVLSKHKLEPNSRIEGYEDQQCSMDYCERLATSLKVSNDFF